MSMDEVSADPNLSQCCACELVRNTVQNGRCEVWCSHDMEQRVLTRLGKDFQVGSQDWNDVTFTGQRIRWMKDAPSGIVHRGYPTKGCWWIGGYPRRTKHEEDLDWFLQCIQDAEAFLDRKIGCSVEHWLQRRTQFHCFYKFSRCDSKAASPTIGDLNAFNMLTRQLKSQSVKLRFWPLTGALRRIGFPDVSYRNNENGSSQRSMTVFWAESRERSQRDGTSYGIQIDSESRKD